MLGTTIRKKYSTDETGTPYYAGYDENQYLVCSAWCNQNNATIVDQGDYYEVVALPAPTLDQLKANALAKAQQTFAVHRDAIRWVNGYGFDCAPEDITNFMAAYTPLLVAGGGSTQYKVWITEDTKGIVTLTLDDMTNVYHSVRKSQLAAYAWYETVKAQIAASQTAEELQEVAW